MAPFRRVGDAWEGDRRRVAWFACPAGAVVHVGAGMTLPVHLRRNWAGVLDLPECMVVDTVTPVDGGVIVRCGESVGAAVLAASDLEHARWN